MTVAIQRLPDHQLEKLAAVYAKTQAQKRLQAIIAVVIIIVCLVLSAYGAEVRLDTFVEKFGGFTSYFGRLMYLDTGAPVWTDPVNWFWGWKKWGALLGQTLLLSYCGTLMGGFFALALGFLASSNLVAQPVIRFAAKRFMEFCRTVPDIVFALVFVVAFGLGPMPGVLAIAIHTMGALGKMFSETVENIDMKPVDGLTATGANWLSTVRFAVLPQVLSVFATYTLLRFEINVRGAAVMGFVGAGGIGQDLLEAIRKFYYSDVSAIVLMIIVTVFVIDLLTERLRHYILGFEGRS